MTILIRETAILKFKSQLYMYTDCENVYFKYVLNII